MAWRGILAFLYLVILPTRAQAQEFPAPRDRNHTIDLYLGSALGSARIIGMGGTATAIAEGSSGMLSNVAAAGVRPATSNDTWDWDWHLDSHSARPGVDFDNNGKDDETLGFLPTVTAGLVVQRRRWGIGFTMLAREVVHAGQDEVQVFSETMRVKLGISRSLFEDQLVLGFGLRTIFLSVERSSADPNRDTDPLLSLSGIGPDFGLVWKPSVHNIRAGVSLSPPIVSNESEEHCDPQDCFGYVLPEKVKAPWTVGLGIAYRKADSVWNRQVKTHWRDEKALVLAGDLIVNGRTKRGVGLEAFAQHQLQPSGRKVTLSFRGGAEYEWVPGRFRIRGGSYWEGGRFRDATGDDISGRLHATAGFDWRIWSFGFWGSPYRLRLSFAIDVADRYGNSGISLGFW